MSGPWKAALLAVALAAGAAAGRAVAAERLKVAVSILPQAYFVERVGGEHVEVLVLVGPGQSPHTYEPTARQMTDLADARVYFRTGVGFERGLLPRLERMFPDLRIVDLRAGVPLRDMAPGAACEDGHVHDGHPGPGAGHEPAQSGTGPAARAAAGDDLAGRDPHIWLSPRLAKIQAGTICDTLAALDPERAAVYRQNLAALEAELERLREELAAVLAPLRGQDVFVFHPAFGYFLDEFGLRQVPVEIEGKEPTARQLVTLIEQARAAGVRVIFVQPQFARKSAAAVAEAIGGVVVPLDPLARDYVANLRDMAAKVRDGLRRQMTVPGPATTRRAGVSRRRNGRPRRPGRRLEADRWMPRPGQ